MGDWQEHKTEFFEAEQGDVLVGKITGTQQTKYGEAVKIVKEDGNTVLVNYTAINEELKDHEGMFTKIECNGEVETDNGRNYKDFTVYFRVGQ